MKQLIANANHLAHYQVLAFYVKIYNHQNVKFVKMDIHCIQQDSYVFLHATYKVAKFALTVILILAVNVMISLLKLETNANQNAMYLIVIYVLSKIQKNVKLVHKIIW